MSSDADERSVEGLFAPYGVVLEVRLPTDPNTGEHKGFGYAEFGTTSEAIVALNKVQGTYLKGRQLYLDFSQTMVYPRSQQEVDSVSSSELMGQPQPINQFADPNNTTVFVGGLSEDITEDELRQYFQGFGKITYVKIPPGNGNGFVRFVEGQAAEMAVSQMQGCIIGNSSVRLRCGRRHDKSDVWV